MEDFKNILPLSNEEFENIGEFDYQVAQLLLRNKSFTDEIEKLRKKWIKQKPKKILDEVYYKETKTVAAKIKLNGNWHTLVMTAIEEGLHTMPNEGYDIPQVKARYVDDNIPYIEVRIYGRATTEHIRKSIRGIKPFLKRLTPPKGKNNRQNSSDFFLQLMNYDMRTSGKSNKFVADFLNRNKGMTVSRRKIDLTEVKTSKDYRLIKEKIDKVF